MLTPVFVRQVPRTFTASEDGLCFIASARTAATLIGLPDYISGVCVQKFLAKYPEVVSVGVTWQLFTKMLQMCQSVAHKRKVMGMHFGGPHKKVNRIKEKLSGKIHLNLEPGVYLCGVSMAVAGHMFVLQVWEDGRIFLHDPNHSTPQPYEGADMSWVNRWSFVIRCWTFFP